MSLAALVKLVYVKAKQMLKCGVFFSRDAMFKNHPNIVSPMLVFKDPPLV